MANGGAMVTRSTNISIDKVLETVTDSCRSFTVNPTFSSDPNLRTIVGTLRPFYQERFSRDDIESLIEGLGTLLENYCSYPELYWILRGNSSTLRRLIEKTD